MSSSWICPYRTQNIKYQFQIQVTPRVNACSVLHAPLFTILYSRSEVRIFSNLNAKLFPVDM